MGRLILNVLLSFAQFEREIISERTRDKIAAARRKGKWSGGMPLLGYDAGPRGSKLVVHDQEAARVRAIFRLYLQHQGLVPVVQELQRRGWRTKRWQTRKGHPRGGRPFTRTNLHKLLTNITYTGQIRYKSEIHAGEHPAIVEQELWQQVQDLLRRNRSSSPTRRRHPSSPLLQGLLQYAACGCATTGSFTTKATRRYGYYLSSAAHKPRRP